MIRTNEILILIFLLFFSCSSSPDLQEKVGDHISHNQWSELLQKHVQEDGTINYNGFKKDIEKLKKYLYLLEDNPPNSTWTRNEQMAYWINAYNAFTVQLIIRHYPIESIKDIGGKIQIPFINSPWDIEFIRIGDHVYDLNDIEHDILREVFKDPRIHFAIVCASKSCPKLLNTAYEAKKLDQQLDKQAKSFINDPTRNKITKDEVEMSKIFSWFKEDFIDNGSLIDFINLYSEVKIENDAKVRYMEYDWALNE